MSWDKELEELRHREGLAEQMGGGEKVARQHSRGKMDALRPPSCDRVGCCVHVVMRKFLARRWTVRSTGRI